MDRNALGYWVEEKFDNQDPSRLERTKSQYKKFGIEVPVQRLVEKPNIPSPPELPKEFSSYRQFFEHASKISFGQDMELLHNLLSYYVENGYPEAVKPNNVLLQQGWSKYSREGIYMERIEAPDEDILVFDVETFVEGGSYPIIATATGKEFSYIWLAKEFLELTPIEEWDQFNHVPLPQRYFNHLATSFIHCFLNSNWNFF